MSDNCISSVGQIKAMDRAKQDPLKGYVDFEILEIYVYANGKTWQNKELLDTLEFTKHDYNEGNWLYPQPHRLWVSYKDKNRVNPQSIHFVIAMDAMTEYWDLRSERLGLMYDKTQVDSFNKQPDVKKLLASIHRTIRDLLPITLFEDYWCPNGEQFCFTEFGKELKAIFPLNDKFQIKRGQWSFSPDIGMEKYENDDGTAEYGWST
jgi:hypothetical protein